MDRSARLCWLFVLLGIGLLVAGAFSGGRSAWLLCRGAVAQGTVIEEVRSSDEEGITYHPRVRYPTAAGEQRTYLSEVGTGWHRYRPGERVAVFYDPEEPGRARIRSFGDLWSGPAFFGGMGLLFAGAGRAMLRRARAPGGGSAEPRRASGG